MDGNTDHDVDCSSAKVSIFKESESRKSDLMDFENGVVAKDVNLCKMDADSDDDEFIDGQVKTTPRSHSDFARQCDTMDLVNERGIKRTKARRYNHGCTGSEEE
ncbi:hypothetical protein Tco_1010523 [Tanacetum coccineum]